MFYKNKFLISVYDSQDFCVGVYDNINEMVDFLGVNNKTLYSIVSRNKNKNNCINYKNYVIHFINYREVHNDIFYEEDILFKEIFKDNTSNAEFCKLNNISQRTYFRNKKKYDRGGCF